MWDTEPAHLSDANSRMSPPEDILIEKILLSEEQHDLRVKEISAGAGVKARLAQAHPEEDPGEPAVQAG